MIFFDRISLQWIWFYSLENPLNFWKFGNNFMFSDLISNELVNILINVK